MPNIINLQTNNVMESHFVT